MIQNNPFCPGFGKEPYRYVKRTDAYSRITDAFDSDRPSNNCYLIMGIRGSGKTVLLSTILNEYREQDDWIAVSLNPGRNLLEMMAAGLYEDAKLQKYFIDASLNLSKFGIGLDIKKNPPISDIQIAIEKMVRIVNEKGKRVLITIDDVAKSDDVVSFAGAFQDLLLKKLNVFLLMTGLYENIYNLQRDKRCTFLMRSEKIVLNPLSTMGMKNQYKETFRCSEDEALKMAVFTKGYSYAFQVLGYIMWDKKCSLKEAIPAFDERMSEYCYEKIWEDLSEKEKEIITLLAKNGQMATRSIAEGIGVSAKTFSVQRDRLIKKGIVDGRGRGVVRLLLPRFEEFVRVNNYEENDLLQETADYFIGVDAEDARLIEAFHGLDADQQKRLMEYLVGSIH